MSNGSNYWDCRIVDGHGWLEAEKETTCVMHPAPNGEQAAVNFAADAWHQKMLREFRAVLDLISGRDERPVTVELQPCVHGDVPDEDRWDGPKRYAVTVMCVPKFLGKAEEAK